MSSSVPACGPNLCAHFRAGARYARLMVVAMVVALFPVSKLLVLLVGDDRLDVRPWLSLSELMGELVLDGGRFWVPEDGDPGTLLAPWPLSEDASCCHSAKWAASCCIGVRDGDGWGVARPSAMVRVRGRGC